ncbi:MAG TPA: hypothetical protein DCY72_05810 [Ruminococcaceae bacterium]|nr:hypothetical protein [Oscillospiraceae bacterium]
MKITGFSPLILTDIADADHMIELFEELGFEQRHKHVQLDGREINDVTMRDADGHCIDIASVPVKPLDSVIIRMNVDDFDEAFELLTARGFVCGSNSVIETPSSKSALMISPTGFKFDLCQHIRKKTEN